MFEKTLEFKQTILLCYGRRKILTLYIKTHMAQVRAIAKVVSHYLIHVVRLCVMNQIGGHWLLLTTLTIIINLIVGVEFEVDSIVNENVAFDLLILNFTC